MSSTHPLAGSQVLPEMLVNVPLLVSAYYTGQPDPSISTQRVAFGTSGHRGCSFDLSFNEWHVLAISQAICEYRHAQGINGPLFLGIDTHALSTPASASALEVLAANGVETRIQAGLGFTPTPVISHAILRHNSGKEGAGKPAALADGVVITPSHNPPEDGGFKYNPPHGGPAEGEITKWVEDRANAILEAGLAGVKRMPFAEALKSPFVALHDYVTPYVDDLKNVLDMDAIKQAGAEPANFLDAGGGANEQMVAAGFEVMLSDPNVRGILINIFGGILRCDIVAQGVVNAARKLDLRLPLVVRLEGTNVEEGRRILRESGLNFETAASMSEAAHKIAALTAGGAA